MQDLSAVENARTHLGDPALTHAGLAQIATAHPDLWPEIARHRLAYPELLDWLDQHGDDNVRQAVAERRADTRDATNNNPGLPTTYPPADTTMRAVASDPQRKLRKDIVNLMWVYPVSLLVQGLVGAIFTIILIAVNAQTVGGFYSPGSSVASSTQNFLDLMTPWMIVMTLIGMIATTCCYFILRQRHLITDITTTTPVGSRFGQLGQVLIAMFAVPGLVAGLSLLIGLTGYDPSGPMYSMLDPFLHSFLGIAYVCVLGPCLEEVVFRGAILRHLLPYGANFAIVTQALLFGITHMNLYQGIFAFAIGLLFGYVALNFSLKWAILLHIINNTLSTLSDQSPVLGYGILGFFSLALIAAVILTIRNKQQYGSLVVAGRPTVIAHPFRVAWSHPLFIVITAIGLIICIVAML